MNKFIFLLTIFIVFQSANLVSQCDDNWIDIRCSPESDEWQTEKRGVVKMWKEDGSVNCTGTLMNNTNWDQKGYILTAAHCLDEPFYAPGESFDWTFRWNYENESCGSDQLDTYYETVGMTIVMVNHQTDVALLEADLSGLDGTGFVPYFNGWNVTGNAQLILRD